MLPTKLLTTIARQSHIRSPPTLKLYTYHHRRSFYSIKPPASANKFITISEEIRYALERKAPIVALESANITCPKEVGALPWPESAEYATRVEEEIRAVGAVPATIMILAGKVHVGVEDPKLYNEMVSRDAMKVAQRDLPYVLGMPGRHSGGLTVAAALTIASMVGIKVLATSAIGGVHRSVTTLMDISSDVSELGRRNVAVVCSGPKVYLDAEGTIEYLETKGVPVATFGEGLMGVRIPAHYSYEGEVQSPLVLKSVKDAARLIYSSHEHGLGTGQLLCNPIPRQFSLHYEGVEKSVQRYFKERKKGSKKDKEVVNDMIFTVRKFDRDRVIEAEQAMLLNNAQKAARVAVELALLETGVNYYALKGQVKMTENEMDTREDFGDPPRTPNTEFQQDDQVGKNYLHSRGSMGGSHQQAEPLVHRYPSGAFRGHPQGERDSYRRPKIVGVSRIFPEPADRNAPEKDQGTSSQNSKQATGEGTFIREPTRTVTEKGFTIRRGAILRPTSGRV